MESSEKIIIGTRGSDLALKQADMAARTLKAVMPDVSIGIRTIVTHGDTDQRPVPLHEIGKGWFTKEIEKELADGTIDIAVHSLKDVGENMPDGLMLAAYLPREDARDVLVAKGGKSLEDLQKGAIIGTDSPRRQAQMLALRPDVIMKSLRGNVPTRLAKLDEKNNDKNRGDSYDAIIIAAAGLKRLGLENRITRYFEPHEMTPAPGQGILVVQARKGDGAILNILKKINDGDAQKFADIERGFARAVGAGCKSPVGAYTYRDGDDCHLIGVMSTKDGKGIIRGELKAPWNECGDLAKDLADELLEKLEK